jgi:hypothetical protein
MRDNQDRLVTVEATVSFTTKVPSGVEASEMDNYLRNLLIYGNLSAMADELNIEAEKKI